MDKLKPKLFSVMKTYSVNQFIKDIIAGIIVAIIALPLSIALALASGVTPEQGLYTAIFAGFVISFLGGSRIQISGPTAAFATIVAGIAATQGMDGLIIATIMAGIILILMGLFKFGNLIKFIPYTITTGFTFGIAVTILIGQLKDFFGLVFKKSPIETIEKLEEVVHSFDTFNVQAFLIGMLALIVLIIWPKINKIIPPSIIAIVITAVLVGVCNLKVNTIGDLYTIKSGLPKVALPNVTITQIKILLPDAFTIAILAAIESLLSCVVADGMIGSKHRSNMELVAQGAGNICSGLVGGIPATGAIARTAANAKNGGRTPVAGMVHSVVLMLVLIFLMPYAALIPMPTIAAILFVVAYNMSEWRKFVSIVRKSPKSDIAVLIVTFVLTVCFDLVVAIGVGLALACLLFMKKMADVTDVQSWTYINDEDEDNDADNLRYKRVPKNTLVFEINGPMFFGAADKFMDIVRETSEDVLIIRMRSVPAIDATALKTLEDIYEVCKENHITLIFSHVNERPMKSLEKSGLVTLIGENNFLPNIDDALNRANEIVHKKK